MGPEQERAAAKTPQAADTKPSLNVVSPQQSAPDLHELSLSKKQLDHLMVGTKENLKELFALAYEQDAVKGGYGGNVDRETQQALRGMLKRIVPFVRKTEQGEQAVLDAYEANIADNPGKVLRVYIETERMNGTTRDPGLTPEQTKELIVQTTRWILELRLPIEPTLSYIAKTKASLDKTAEDIDKANDDKDFVKQRLAPIDKQRIPLGRQLADLSAVVKSLKAQEQELEGLLALHEKGLTVGFHQQQLLRLYSQVRSQRAESLTPQGEALRRKQARTAIFRYNAELQRLGTDPGGYNLPK